MMTMPTARLRTACEVIDGVLSLIADGIVVPVWDHECNDVGLWPASDVPPDAEPMDIDEVRAHAGVELTNKRAKMEPGRG